MEKERFYRQSFNASRFTLFYVRYRESDLCIGVEKKNYHPSMPAFVFHELMNTRDVLEQHAKQCPDFISSLQPLNYEMHLLHPLLLWMYQAAEKAGVGPMAAVAGAVSRHIAEKLKKYYQLENAELFVENGGDICIQIYKPLLLGVYAGKSPLSQHIGVMLQPWQGLFGVCTSAGTVGHSLSFGKADAALVICHDAALADAWATSLGNKIKSENEVATAIAFSQQNPEILGALAICGETMAAQGNMEVVPLQKSCLVN